MAKCEKNLKKYETKEWKVYLLSRPVNISGRPISHGKTSSEPEKSSLPLNFQHWSLLLQSGQCTICIDANEDKGMVQPQITSNEPKDYVEKIFLDKIEKSYKEIYTMYETHKLRGTPYHMMKNNCHNYINEFCKMLGISNPKWTGADLLLNGAAAAGVGLLVGTVGTLGTIGYLATLGISFLMGQDQKNKKVNERQDPDKDFSSNFRKI